MADLRPSWAILANSFEERRATAPPPRRTRWSRISHKGWARTGEHCCFKALLPTICSYCMADFKPSLGYLGCAWLWSAVLGCAWLRLAMLGYGMVWRCNVTGGLIWGSWLWGTPIDLKRFSACQLQWLTHFAGATLKSMSVSSVMFLRG